MVEHEHGGPGKPLSVELPPYGLSPSGVGHGQVQRPFVQVVPEHARGEVSHGIEEVVSHHLGFSAGSAGEIHEHGVAVVVLHCGPHKGRCLLHLGEVVVETLGNGFPVVSDGDILSDRRTFFACGLNLLHHIVVVNANDGFHRSPGVAVNDVVLGEHVRGGNHHGPNLVQCEHHNPPLVAPFQDEHHRVALANAERHEVGGGLVRLLLQLPEGGANLFAQVVGPQQGQLVRCFLGPCIHHVVGKVEVLGNDKLQVIPIILYRRERCLF